VAGVVEVVIAVVVVVAVADDGDDGGGGVAFGVGMGGAAHGGGFGGPGDGFPNSRFHTLLFGINNLCSGEMPYICARPRCLGPSVQLLCNPEGTTV